MKLKKKTDSQHVLSSEGAICPILNAGIDDDSDGLNDEFEDNLRWLLIDKLLELPKETLFDALIYLRAKLMEDRKFFY